MKKATCEHEVGFQSQAESRLSERNGILRVGWGNLRFVDDLTGLPLPPDLCRAARQKELDYFKSKGVWEVRIINEAPRKMGRSPSP